VKNRSLLVKHKLSLRKEEVVLQVKFDQNHQLEEMVQFLIRILGKTNEKIVELEERLRRLEVEREKEEM
jgi:hypothetical protein